MNNLKKLRRQKGLTQVQLSALANVSMINISKAENGHIRMGYIVAKKLSIALECKVSEVLIGNKPLFVKPINVPFETRLKNALKEKGSIVFSIREVKEKGANKDFQFFEDYADYLSENTKSEWHSKDDCVFFIGDESRIITGNIGDIAKKVKEAREKLGYSQVELAKILCCSNSVISHIENGQSKGSFSTKRMLEDVLNISLA